MSGHPEIVIILQEKVPKKCLATAAAKFQVVPAQLGSMAGVIGAARTGSGLIV